MFGLSVLNSSISQTKSSSLPSLSSSLLSSTSFNSEININDQNETYFSNYCHYPTAIKCTNLSFYYNNQSNDENSYCLKNLNLNIPFSSIYALLGPSGCGKTTLIKIILSQFKPTQGTITIFGNPNTSKYSGIPGTGVGYMPQELALILNLTIYECFTYFARIYFISKNETKHRIKEILNIFNLTKHQNKLISQLSGGQQRRVSFGCSIIHKPRLLILDEPTVGLDPILKNKIWNHLNFLSKKKQVTILITTHYIEEAKSANIISFLNNGNLLVEQSPDYLLQKFNTNSLEKLFYIFQFNLNNIQAIDQESERINIKTNSKNTIKRLPWIHPSSENYNFFQKWFIQFNAIIRQHFILTLRKPEVVLAQYILPIIAISFFCVCIGSTPNGIKLAIINYENCSYLNNLNGNLNPNQFQNFNQFIKNLTKTFQNKLLKSPNLPNMKYKRQIEKNYDNDNFMETYYEDPYQKFENACFSNILINSLNNFVFTKIPYSSTSKAIQDVKNGYLWGALTIKSNFSKAILSKIFFQDNDINLNQSLILINSDITKKILTITLDISFTRIYPKFVKSVLNEANQLLLKSEPSLTFKRFNLNSGKLPIIQEKDIFGQHYIPSDFFGVRDFALPGLLIVITYSVSFALTVFSLINDYSFEIAHRHFVTGISNTQIILSHLFTRFVFTSTGTILLLYVAIYFFQVSCKGSFLLAINLLLMQSYCAMTHAMVISSIFRSIFICAAVSNGYLVFIFIVSGVLWSYETLPFIMKIIGSIQPITLPCEGLRSILIRGQGLENIVVLKGFLVTFIWIIIHLLISIYIFNLRKK